MIVNIRGGLGMQLLEAFSGLEPLEREPDAIHINTGGLSPHLCHDYLTPLFDTDIPILKVMGNAKQGAFNFNGFVRARRFVERHKLNVETRDKNLPEVLHLRKMDRQIMSDEMFEAIQQQCPTYYPVQSFEEATLDQTIHDWKTFLAADSIVGPLSTFTLSTLLFDPNKSIFLFQEEDQNGPHRAPPEAFNTIRMLISEQVFPNLQWFPRVNV